MWMKNIIDVSNLPKGGPYSHAVINNDIIFVSGQAGQNESNKNVFNKQFENAIEKIKIILENACSSLEKVLKVSVYLSDRKYFNEMNELFKKYFSKAPPARTTLITSFVDEYILIEIDVIAAK